MSFVGRSHLGLITAMGVWIVIVFALAARGTKAQRVEIVGAVVGGIVAAAGNLATDSAAHALGFWRYPEVTTPFGPLLYYLEAGLGCAAIALFMLWLRRRTGLRGPLWLLAVVAIYAPIRDWVTARLTGLIEFHYDRLIIVLVADSLSSLVIPVSLSYGVLCLFTRAPSRWRQV